MTAALKRREFRIIRELPPPLAVKLKIRDQIAVQVVIMAIEAAKGPCLIHRTGDGAGHGEEVMKFSLFVAAFVAAMAFGGTVSVPTPAAAQNAAACKHHLQGFHSTSGPAQEAMKKNYQACLKKKK